MSATHAEAAANGRVTRKDIESKLRQIRSDVDTAEEAAKGAGTVAAGVGVILLILLVYLLGKKRGKRSSTVVEVRRF